MKRPRLALDTEASESIEFLERAFAGAPGFLSVAASVPDGRLTTRTVAPQDISKLARFIGRYNGERNLYWSVNPLASAKQSKATKADIAALSYAHVDIDPRDGEQLASERARIRRLLDASPLAPTIAIDSGSGFQLFWKLRKPILCNGNIEALEEINKRLETFFGGDRCHNIDRLMRLPNTTNFPNKVKRDKGRAVTESRLIEQNGNLYDVDDFAVFERESPPKDESKLNTDLPQRVQDLAKKNSKLLKRLQGDTIGLNDTSRSGLEFSIAALLARAGCFDDEIGTALRAYSPDSKAREKNGDRYIARMLEKIHEKVDPPRTDDASDRELEYEFADQLGDQGDEADELVERLLTRGASSVVYGDSNTAKTFFVIELGCSIAQHLQWMGRNVEPGLIVYLASESPASVRLRLRAYQRYHERKVPNFVIVKSPINLYSGAADTELVIKLVRKLEEELGVKCELVIGDTLSRLCAGANENSGEDMSIVVRHVDRIRHECRAHFLLVHHTGKDAARGMRGWSGMRAACDTEIEISVDDESGVHAAEITKQRDIPGKGDRVGFQLKIVEMGINKWGKMTSSCVVIDADAPPKQERGKRPSEIAGAITEFLMTCSKGIRKRELVEHFDGRYRSNSIYRELKKMFEARTVHETGGRIYLGTAETTSQRSQGRSVPTPPYIKGEGLVGTSRPVLNGTRDQLGPVGTKTRKTEEDDDEPVVNDEPEPRSRLKERLRPLVEKYGTKRRQRPTLDRDY
jgi:KaiC/GvpD/RAD55 family RecA-like ATPase